MFDALLVAAVCFSLHSAGQKCSLAGLGADVLSRFMEKKKQRGKLYQSIAVDDVRSPLDDGGQLGLRCP